MLIVSALDWWMMMDVVLSSFEMTMLVFMSMCVICVCARVCVRVRVCTIQVHFHACTCRVSLPEGHDYSMISVSLSFLYPCS